MARIIAVAILSLPTNLLKYLCQVTWKIKPAAPVANTIKYKGIDTKGVSFGASAGNVCDPAFNPSCPTLSDATVELRSDRIGVDIG